MLAGQGGPFDAETRRVSWETLVAHGPSLYRTFAGNPRAASTAKAMRDCVLRQENFIEALASADETLAWCKMCIHHNLPLRPQDPIIGTAAAVLDNLATRLRPFLQCYLKARGLCGLDELCSRRRLADIKDIASFVFVILARLANRVERGVAEIDYATLGVGVGEKMHFYLPGACMAGLIEILDTHRQECSSRVCELTASHIVAPPVRARQIFLLQLPVLGTIKNKTFQTNRPTCCPSLLMAGGAWVTADGGGGPGVRPGWAEGTNPTYKSVPAPRPVS